MASQIKQKMFRLRIIWILITVISAYTVCLCAEETTTPGVKYVFQIKQHGKRSLFRRFQEYNLTQLYRITPSTYIFKYSGSRNSSDLLRRILFKKKNRDKILEAEPIREYKDSLRPEGTVTEEFDRTQTSYRLAPTNLVCEKYYGMGVPEAWSRGYSGRGVSIAVTDVGINTQLVDLKDNINTSLSYNFVDDTRNVTPEYFPNILEKASKYTDHGNKVTSIVGAIKGNNHCSAGIAYNSDIAALKIYKVKLVNDRFLGLDPSHWTRSDIIARALVHELNNIDIFANAWAPTHAFDTLDLATREAIKHGAEHGRHGLGTVHVVPSGPPGNGLANNIHTITVNSIGRHGTIPEHVYIDASVLTCGLDKGNNLTASSMVTTAKGDKCVSDFNGVSAATSQIAPIIGLALEANNNLSLRDIQHLLVRSSGRQGLREKGAFRRNADGKYFHAHFGFGLINAETLVMLAEKQLPTPRLLSQTLNTDNKRRQQVFEFCHLCNHVNKRHCLTTTEHVLVKMNLKTTSDEIKVTLKSPGGTTSVLVDSKQGKPVNVKGLRLVSVHFWDELPFGSWLLLVKGGQLSSRTEVNQVSLTLYGTNIEAIAHFQHLYGDICNKANDTGNDTNTTTLKPITTTTLKVQETKKRGPDLTALYVMFSLAFGVFFLVLIKIRYGGSLPTLCPERKEKAEYENVASDPSDDDL